MSVWAENTNCGLKKTSGANPQSRRAFTLIELMLVLVILATLSAIVVPKLTGQVGS